jgi:hypothetical protein
MKSSVVISTILVLLASCTIMPLAGSPALSLRPTPPTKFDPGSGET